MITDNTEWNRQQEDAAMGRLTVVNRAQCIADQKSIGAPSEWFKGDQKQ